MVMHRYRIFSMCSTYDPDKRPVCAFLAPKTQKVIDDMRKIRADCLLWAVLGSGVAGLPLLKLEAEGRRPWNPGGMSDVEFIRQCEKAGIKVFAVVWEAQGYDKILVGIENGRIKSWMRRFGDGKKIRWGLDAFYRGKYPEIGRWEEYFSGKFEKNGEVESLVDEGACRSIFGTKPWVVWIFPHVLGPYSTYAMCRNSPYWREYLKRMIEIQIDYGAHGIQFDESAIPFDCIWCGAGYCDHCNREFLSYLREKYGDENLRRMGIHGNFNFRKYLLKRLVGPIRAHLIWKHFPLWKDHRIAMLRSIDRTFEELSSHARGYAERMGRKVEITGNFVMLMPAYMPLVKHVDFISMELRFGIPPESRHHPIYKLGISLGDGKELAAVPSVDTSLKLRRRGKRELLKHYAYEAFSCQANFMAPYSCYTGIGKPYYPPIEPIAEANEFIHLNRDAAEGERLADVAVAFSFHSHLMSFAYIMNRYFSKFRRICEKLAEDHLLYDVIILGDGELVPRIVGKIYDVVIVPGCELENEWEVLRQVRSLQIVEENPDTDIERMIDTDAPAEVFFSSNQTESHAYVHMLNYDYDMRNDRMRPKTFRFDMTFPYPISQAEFISEHGTAEIKIDGKRLRCMVDELHHLAVVKVKKGG